MSEEVTSKTQWGKQRDHNVCLPSGARVVIRIPDLPTLIEVGELPQTLLDTAIKSLTGSDENRIPTVDEFRQEREFREHLVAATVVKPSLTPDDVKNLPAEDIDLIVALALRKTDLDAEGEHIGGLTSSEKYRKFRGLDLLDQALADV